MSNIMSFVWFVLILGIIIVIHEFGHLLAAKKFGVYCKEFSIGMGPKIWQTQKGETAWSVRALPIGGFVAMAGEDEDSDENEDLDIPYERTLPGIASWKQIIVMFAGPFMNVLLAWAIFIGLTAYQGEVEIPNGAVVSEVATNSVAEAAGFLPNDKILKIENVKKGEEVIPEDVNDVFEFIQYYPGEVTCTVLRDGKQVILHATPKYNKEENVYLLGMGFSSGEKKSITLLEAIPYGTQRMVDSISTIIDSLGKLVHGIGLDNLSGPVGIFQITAETTQNGLFSTLSLVALLSINIGIVNLLPIPILDGGRILIVLIESLIGRKLSEKVQTAIMFAGLLMIVGIMILATWNDIVRLF